MSPAPTPQGGQRGLLFAVGGAEDHNGAMRILRHFWTLAGGADARIVIMPTGSADDRSDAGQPHYELFRAMEPAQVEVLPVFERQDGHNTDLIARLQDATAVFLTGDNQLRFSAVLGGTPLAQALRRRHAGGLLVGGTSAGAAVLCEHMIAFGEQGSLPVQRMMNFAPGLGLTNRLIIDQHFSQRLRTGRLLAATAYNPFLLGVGIDEDTAVIIDAANRLRVIGQHSAVVVDASTMAYTDIHKIDEVKPVALLGVTLHVLIDGYGYDIDKRRPLLP